MSKVPRKWTSEEDNTLLHQIALASRHGKGRDWTSIAAQIPGRSNKDCRKRWCNHHVGGLRKGPWEPDEDRRLAFGVQEHDQQWPLVAEEVGTRSPDQCAKRWQQSLNPALNRSRWSKAEEQTLLRVVEEHGRCWKSIQMRYFPNRATNNVKNRYVTLTRHQSLESDSIEDIDGRIPHPISISGTDVAENHLTEASATSNDVSYIGSPSSAEIQTLFNSELHDSQDFTSSNIPVDETLGSPGSLEFLLNAPSTLIGDELFPSSLDNGHILDYTTENFTSGNDAHRHIDDPSTADYRNFLGTTEESGTAETTLLLDNDPTEYSNDLGHSGFACEATKTSEFVLTISDPAQDIVTDVTNALLRSGTKFKIEMK